MKVHAADLLTIAGGVVLITTGTAGWAKAAGVACLAVVGVVLIRRSIRAAETRRQA